MVRVRRLGLRGRLMLIGVLGLVFGLGLGGGLLVYALNATLVRSLDDAARGTAHQVATLVDEHKLTDPIPVESTAGVVQVVDGRGRVVATTAGADRLVPMLTGDALTDARHGAARQLPGDRLAQAAPMRVVAAPAGRHGRLTVLAAVPAGELAHAVHLVRTVLLIAYPLLVAALAVVAWLVVGAALRPVESLRRGAERITGAGSADGRLPVPAGTDEVARLASTLNGMLRRLQDGQRRQRAFVADAAHELRSPVTSIRTQLEVARRLGDAADWPEVADDVLVDTERLSRLTEDLLLLARTGDPAQAAQRLARYRRRVDLGQLAGEVVERYASARVPVRLTDDESVHTDGDPAALARVLANLLDNAVRHATTVVQVAVGTRGDRAMVTVRDDGPGIPPADRERVFDRFTRLDDARARDAGGSGLGLAIVADLVRLHGGGVELSTAHHRDANTAGPGGPGLRVDVLLPVAD